MDGWGGGEVGRDGARDRMTEEGEYFWTDG